ncbi:hypothetical protein PRIPAC_82507 [Pristionchus pacificus]|uniref:Uncharacterized protein n=1 Tax=Pristionchus pacificus TaxID=54126 RepID=A0A2A6CN69_PRIPA|nr:hypothetical protein PRIPAC_82507 [Pristionchus pacificus]|eukprot:PDM79644.1 hypothetical protein PRIPAC_32223 [Pristionchus pacificus]
MGDFAVSNYLCFDFPYFPKTEEDRPSGRPKKTVSSNAPNSKTRKRSIAEVDDIVVGGTEAEVGEDFNTWDLITNETNDKEGYDDEDEEEETILERSLDAYVGRCYPRNQPGFRKVAEVPSLDSWMLIQPPVEQNNVACRMGVWMHRKPSSYSEELVLDLTCLWV